MARSKQTWNGTISEPEGFPTDRQCYVIARLLRENPSIKAPAFPRTRLEASKLIDTLKKRTSS